MSAKPRRNDRFVSFANPPAGSVLVAATDELTRIAATGDITDPVMLRRIAISALEGQGMPPSPRPPWCEALLDKDVTRTQQQLAALASAPPRHDSPNAFAAMYGMMVFLQHYRRPPDGSFERSLDGAYRATAEDLGPGVGLHEVEFLVRWFFAGLNPDYRTLIAHAITAVESVDFDSLRTNLSVTGDEFCDIAGILDSRRFV